MRAGIIIAALVVLVGCSAETPEPSMDPAVRNRLLADVAAVEAAAMRHDRASAEVALAKLRRDVASAQSTGRLDGQRAGVVLAAAERVAEDVRTLPFGELPAPPPHTVTVRVPAGKHPLPVAPPPNESGSAERITETETVVVPQPPPSEQAAQPGVPNGHGKGLDSEQREPQAPDVRADP